MHDMSRPDPSVESLSVAAFVCRASEGLWTGIERALDNGTGLVFVVDDSGVMQGYATLTEMRAAVRKGLYLGDAHMADVTTPLRADVALAVRPRLDSAGRITSVSYGPHPGFLPVAVPDLSHRELRNLLDAFLSTWISSTGEYITTFEQTFAAKCDMAHGVATANGTVSLHLALAALGIGEGDEVIVPDFTFAASANTVIHVGARPVLVDVDASTWCVSPEIIERAITPRTRAIMPVHVFGRPAPMTEIAALAKKHGLFVIEDCAEAHGAAYDGRPVGSFSDIASFSFFANKIITTGEGGICLTNNPDLAARMRMLRDHGMRPDRRYWHEEPGFNFRMTNMQAAIGCAQIERMNELLAMRERVHRTYEAAFQGVPGVNMPPPMPQNATPVTWFSCATVPADKRAALIAACKAANIDLRPFFHGLSSMPAYRRYARLCPNSATLAATGVNLPTMRAAHEGVAQQMADIFRGVLS